MKAFRWSWLFFLASAFAAAAEPRPLVQAHAHNDYEHARPLFEALEQGFCSIEADVYLVNGQLLVAHERKDAKANRTLAELYLDPLCARVAKNGGRVFPGGPPATLLVDVKSDAEPTYAVLHELLARYADMLTSFRNGRMTVGAVTVIVSGNRALGAMAAQPLRYAAIDGRSDEVDARVLVTLMPWVSMNWDTMFTWKWGEAMPADVQMKLLEWSTAMHVQGRLVRFWGTPDRPDVWRALLEGGVDLIGTDDLAGLRAFLNERAAEKKK